METGTIAKNIRGTGILLILCAALALLVNPSSAASKIDKDCKHLLNRISFGASADALKDCKEIGTGDYLEQQLNPSNIDNSEFENKYLNSNGSKDISPLDTYEWGESKIQEWLITHQVRSKRQLEEMMAFFWDNHFNTEASKTLFFWSNKNSFLDFNELGITKLGVNKKDAYLFVNAWHYQPDASKLNKLVFRLQADKSIDPNLEIIWMHSHEWDIYDNEDEWLEANTRSIPIKIKNDGKFHDYELTIDHADWKNDVSFLGFKIDGSGKNNEENFILSEFRLESSSDPSLKADFNFNNIDNEVKENEFFRANALGNFEDLLKFSAHSPNMLIFLDNWNSNKDNPNENYARELMELHTMGVDGGYSQADVESAARLLTGWTVRNNAFYFDADNHASGTYNFSFLSGNIPPGGESSGNLFLEGLAEHPRTAEFICKKLIEYFVNDELRSRNDPLVSSCASTFLSNKDSKDQIEKVLRVILSSDEFTDESNKGTKIPTPLEFTISMFRKLELEDWDEGRARQLVFSDNYNIFFNPSPTGFKENGRTWLSASGQLLGRINFSGDLLGHDEVMKSYIDLLKKHTNKTSSGVVDFSLDYFTEGEISSEERKTALNRLGKRFKLNKSYENQERLRQMMRYILSLPQSQLN